MKPERPSATMIILAFLFLPYFSWAQGDYVVRLSGDTLKGNLKILAADKVDQVLITVDGKKTHFTALQVRSLSKDNDTYKGVVIDNAVHFMKVLKDGYLSLNAYNTATPNSWDGRYLTKRDGTGMEVPNLSFKKMLGKYLSDCPDIKNRIESGDLSKRDIERIVDLYNACIQAKTEAASIKNASPVVIDNEKVLAVKNLITKVEAANFLTKNDALDVLKDIQSKVTKNEAVPKYLVDGLKSYLADTPSLNQDLDTLMALLKK
jgi:hypothetical protein